MPENLVLLRKERCQVAFLQETHLSDLEHIKLGRNWVGQVFYSSYISKSRGVAILLHSLPFTLDKTISDKERHYMLLSGYLYGEYVVFGCIYAPTIYDGSFIPQLSSDLASFSSPYLLLGGDLDCTPNPRVLHPRDKDYTFLSIPHQVFSRIDYFLSSRIVLARILNCSIDTKFLSPDISPSTLWKLAKHTYVGQLYLIQQHRGKMPLKDNWI